MAHIYLFLSIPYMFAIAGEGQLAASAGLASLILAGIIISLIQHGAWTAHSTFLVH